MRSFWVFHASPARSTALADLRAGQTEVRRCVTQHAADLAVGDGVVLWLSGAAAGVYAVGQVAGEVQEDGGATERPSRSCLLRWDEVRPDDPIPKARLLAAGGFDRARIVRQPMGGNPLRMTEQEWQTVQALR